MSRHRPSRHHRSSRMPSSDSKRTSVLGNSCRRRIRPRPETSRVSNHNQPPQWILDDLFDLLDTSTGGVVEIANTDGDNKNHEKEDISNNKVGDGRWLLQDISEAKSAQQQVYILRFVNSSDIVDSNVFPDRKHSNRSEWADVMRSGNNRLVLRIWKGGSRWWNLNRNENPLELAKSEIMGYKVARKALEDYDRSFEREKRNEARNNNNNNNNNASNTREMISWMVPKIPRVLHFYVPPAGQQKMLENPSHISSSPEAFVSESLCWAVLEYVGVDENENLTTTDKHGIGNGVDDVKVDRSYLEGMIKIRREFGFEEPHPRWGRVPVDKALPYARSILNEVLLPLHRYSSRLVIHYRHYNHSSREEKADVTTKTFSGMVKIYRQAWNDASKSIQRIKYEKQLIQSSEGWDSRIEMCLERLDRGISLLSGIEKSDSARIPPLDPVLLHLDLQPQNLIFYKPSAKVTRPNLLPWSGQKKSLTQHEDDDETVRKKPSVFSVLDWEDAAWGDPRFDLVLLCRKVCANRDQADALWSQYAGAMAAGITTTANHGGRDRGGDQISKPNTPRNQRKRKPEESKPLPKQNVLGLIEPWLRLETVHSIATMLLQSMDLVNGGRNPWETKDDLWGKLRREFTRLEGYITCK